MLICGKCLSEIEYRGHFVDAEEYNPEKEIICPLCGKIIKEGDCYEV